MQAKVFKRKRQVKRHGHRVAQRGDVPWGQDGQKLTWRSHIEYARQKARATGAKLYPKQDIEGGTSEQSDSHQFGSSIAPDLRLGPKSHLKKLEAVENIALRTAVDAPWYVRNVDIQRRLKFTTATEKIKQSAVKIFQKAESSENQFLREPVNYPELEAPHKRP